VALSSFDPDKAYAEIMEVQQATRDALHLDLDPAHTLISRMSAAWEDLNQWMCAGGAPPKAWGVLSKIPEVTA